MDLSENSFYRKLFNNSPVGMMVYDSRGRCHAANSAVCSLMGMPREQILAENYNRINSWEISEILEEVKKTAASGIPFSKQANITSYLGQEIFAQITFIPFAMNGVDYLLFIVNKLPQTITSEDQRKPKPQPSKDSNEPKPRAVLPLCSFCKKIRDDEGYWEQVDVYIHNYLKTDISHSICPSCAKKHYPELYNEKQ